MWITLLAGRFGLLLIIENKTIVVAVIIPCLLIASAVFSILINRKLKILNKRFEKEDGVIEPPLEK
jgi:hypothetical protein